MAWWMRTASAVQVELCVRPRWRSSSRPHGRREAALALAIATHLAAAEVQTADPTAPRRCTTSPATLSRARVSSSRAAVKGHVYSLDFLPEFQSWEPQLRARRALRRRHAQEPDERRRRGCVQREARGCSHLVLWLDCDREGENICFEVMRPGGALALVGGWAAGVARALLGGERGRGPKGDGDARRAERGGGVGGRRAAGARPQGGRRVHALPDAPLPRAPPAARRLDDLVRPVPDADAGVRRPAPRRDPVVCVRPVLED